MKFIELIEFFKAIPLEECPYLIAGGMAVVAHGHVRMTYDLDLVIATSQESIENWVRFLKDLEFTPSIPIKLDDFLSSENRENWKIKRNLQVLSLTSPKFKTLVLDLFVEPPFDFEEEFKKAAWIAFPSEEFKLPFVSKSTLIQMKKAVARPMDLDDVHQLEEIDESE